MPETDLRQPGPGLLHAGPEATELAQAASVPFTEWFVHDLGAGR